MRLIFILTILSFATYGQTKTKGLRTLKYSGTFRYDKGKRNASGTIVIYPETDTTVLFYIDISKGAPSYNMGSLYGRLKIVNGEGSYESKDNNCRWTVQFLKNKLTIETASESYECGFGNHVVIDGLFKQTSKTIPDYFVNGEGTKYFFNATTPEEYYNERKLR
jgi:hypothetical protein